MFASIEPYFIMNKEYKIKQLLLTFAGYNSNLFYMKRSTTPIIREKPIQAKSQANLKAPPQLKILNNQVKRNISKNIISTQQSIYKDRSIQQTSILKKTLSSLEKNKYQPLSFQRKDSDPYKPSTGSYTKRLNSFAKYLQESNNPETQCSPRAPRNNQQGLTKYLVSKCWQNSNQILSPQVNSQMRKLVAEWLIQLSHYMKLKRETLHHTMWIMERCLQKITDLNSKNLQLLAITALFISTKYEEIYPPHVIALIEKTLNSYHKSQVIDLEQKILIALNFQLTAPNRYTFLNLAINDTCQYLQEYDCPERITNIKTSNRNSKVNDPIQDNKVNKGSNNKRYIDFLHYLLQLTLLKSFPSTCSQKEIADSVIYVVNKVMKKQSTQLDSDNWLYLTKVQQTAYEIIQLWKQNQSSIVSFLYDSDQWSFVGGLTILF